MSDRSFIIDRGNPANVRVGLDAIRSFLMSGKGTVRVQLVAHRRRRSDRQNRFYWPCFVQPFADFLRAQADAPVSADDADDTAHEILKAQYLAKTVMMGDGRKVRYVGSTTVLDTEEFNDYLDRAAEFLAGFGIVVPEPSDYHEPVDRSERVKQMRQTA